MSQFPYDAVIFDLDGTLFDSKACVIEAITLAMEWAGLPIPQGVDFGQMVGPPLKETFPTLLKVPADRVEEAIGLQRKAFYEQVMYHYPVYPYIRTLLRTLHENGVYVALATSKTLRMGMGLLRMAHLNGYFDCIAGEDETLEKLGKPEIIRRALPPGCKRPVMVGDRCFDLEGAKANHMEAIAVGYGYGSMEELSASGYTAYAATTRELYRLLCGNTPPSRGFFLSVEGPDGCGKSTQIRLIAQKLEQFGFEPLLTREPGGCPISEKIRQIILDTENADMCPLCEALLYAASRAQHVEQVIRPALAEGRMVLSDRFVDSSVAYQGGARGLGVEQVQAINAPAVEGCLPDATLYLDMPAEAAMARRYAATAPDRLELEGLGFAKAVEKGYREILASQPERFIVVDANRPPEVVAAEALEKILDRAAPNNPKWNE